MLKKKAIFLGIIAILFIISSILFLNLNPNRTDDYEIEDIEIDKIKLLMTQEEVEGLYGKGPDNTPGCFGCGLNFIYPELKLSGRYSETLDRNEKNGDIDWNKSPKVKELTTAKENFSVLGIQIGSSLRDARIIMGDNGYKLQSNANEHFYNYYYKNNLFIRLWNDNELFTLEKDNSNLGENDEKVRSITLAIRVKKDEEIMY